MSNNKVLTDKYFNSSLFKKFMEKLSELEDSGDKISSWGLVEAFWFMRLNFNHFFKHVKQYDPTQKADELKIRINTIKANIIKHYSKAFDSDFSKFTLNMVNEIYRNTDSIDINFINSLCSQDNLDIEYTKCIELLKNFIDIIENVKTLKMDMLNFMEKAQHCEYELPLKRRNDISLLDITNVKKFVYGRNVTELQKDASKIEKRLSSIQSLIENLTLNYEDNVFKKTRELLTFAPKQENIAEDILASLEYAIDGSFNCELILIFIFNDLDYKSSSKYMKSIIKKHEKFFINIYKKLIDLDRYGNVKILTHVHFCPEEILEPYLSCDKNFVSKFNPDTKPDILQLKQLLALFSFYCRVSKENVLISIENSVRDYLKIIENTKMTNITYDPVLDDLPSYVMNFFGLNKNDLASILGIDPSTVSRQLKNPKKMISNNLWFWKVATGFTYTYLNGNTTISDYGKHYSSDETKYLFSPIQFIAYAELFLERISELQEYQEALRDGKILTKKKYILSKKYIDQISNEAIKLSGRIREHRIALDNLYECYLYRRLNDEKSLNSKDVLKDKEYLKEKNKEISELVDKYFNNIVKLLYIGFYEEDIKPRFLTGKIYAAKKECESDIDINDVHKKAYEEAIKNFSIYLDNQSIYIEKVNAIINEMKQKNTGVS